MEATVEELSPTTGTAYACRAMGVCRATIYRRRKPPLPAPKRRREPSPRALSPAERSAVLETLISPRFVDRPPGQVVATLLDEGRYIASERTMYRVLADNAAVGERRRQLTHPKYEKPELIAQAPNTVWSWDITKLRGPHKWNHFSLYVVLDIFSRYAVSWTVHDRESGAVATALIERAVRLQKVTGDLTVHADNGGPMRSKPVAFMLADLGVTKSHSRPHTSNDNPFSEAQFKTLKYCPRFPDRFANIFEARAFCREFFDWYNNVHRHSGIGMMTPADVHHGRAAETYRRRAAVLDRAYTEHPERFVKQKPLPPIVPTAVWINRPEQTDGRREGEVIAA